jgi:hypothetical protein
MLFAAESGKKLVEIVHDSHDDFSLPCVKNISHLSGASDD